MFVYFCQVGQVKQLFLRENIKVLNHYTFQPNKMVISPVFKSSNLCHLKARQTDIMSDVDVTECNNVV